ncbi:5-hydroxytryptamine receptor 1A [Biomphalaria glabrata]|nr:5-hydroxytryptamine receptor 1A [Biomphalaria glabrata]
MVWLKAIPLVLLAFLTVTFNVVVLWMFKVKKSLRSCKNIYLASLAMADLIIGACMFLATVEQVKGRVEWLPFISCRVYLVVRQSALYISLLSLLLITGDRWWSIHYPFSYRTRRRKRNAFLAVGFVWCIGFALQTIPVAVWDVIDDWPKTHLNSSDNDVLSQTLPTCEVPFLYSISFVAAVSVVQYFIPLVSMLTLNCSLYVGILSRKKIQIRRSLNSSERLYSYDKRNSISSVQDFSSSAEEYAELLNGFGHSNKTVSTCRLNTARRFSAGPVLLRTSQSGLPITSLHMSTARRFSWTPRKCSLRPSKDGEELARSLLVKQDRRAACWLGLLVIVFLVCWLPHTIVGILLTLRHNGVPHWARDVTFWFLLANSAINPLLYGFFNKEIREAFKQWMFGGTQRRLTVKNAVFVYGVSIPVNARRISSFDTVPE